MRRQQYGMTTLGFIILMIPVAIVFYAVVRVIPVYLNYMNVAHALTQVSTEISGDTPDIGLIKASVGKHFDVEQITFPDVKDLKISRADGVWTIEADYEDQAPLFANVFLLMQFDKTVRLKANATQ
jgi:uncharacterized protein DUF4845